MDCIAIGKVFTFFYIFFDFIIFMDFVTFLGLYVLLAKGWTIRMALMSIHV